MSGINEYADESGVVRLNINFTLDQDYKEVVLRLARAGVETTEVTVDGKRTHHVTAKMLGSKEGGIYGVFDLMLGSLSKDNHTIQLALSEDKKSKGRIVWDALVLYAM